MGNQYTVGCLSLYDALGAGTHIGLTQIDYPTNAEVTGNDSGSLYEEFLAVTGFAPVCNFTSKCIPELLTHVGLDGQCVGADFDVTAVDVIHRQIGNCQNDLSGTPHIRDRCVNGLLRLGSLTADRNGDAVITGILDTLSDGNNGPVARTDGVALPSPIAAKRFRIGKPKIGGVVFDEVDNWQVDFAVSIAEKTPAVGSIWPEQVGVITVRTVVTLRGRDLSKVTHALLQQAAASAGHADTVLQLISLESGGNFLDFNSSGHINLTVAGLAVPENLGSGSANQRTTTSLRLSAAWDGSNAPVLFNLNTTYDPTP